MCDTLKKIFKIVGIIAAIAGAAAGVYMLIKKFCPKFNPLEDDKCDYVSCSCFEDEEPEAPQA